MIEQIVKRIVHRPLDQEIAAIGGRYALVKKARLPFHGREALYWVGYGAFDTTCCGVGGRAHALGAGRSTGLGRDRLLAAKSRPGRTKRQDDLFAVDRPRGLPIGNLTSQFWANCYLNPFDHFVKRELRCCKQRGGYLRYVDDFLLFAGDNPTLWEWREAVVERLARFRLTIHPGAHPRPVT
ncbi:MAG: RNA-directed DNA polymerase, partial [Chloroflexota bacterium]|nr:RNA-directed DNA polymerase [Chloroflexota bacterium]